MIFAEKVRIGERHGAVRPAVAWCVLLLCIYMLSWACCCVLWKLSLCLSMDWEYRKEGSRIVLALVVIVLLALPSTDANAVSAVVTGGSIAMNTTTPVPFDDVFISLQGPGFYRIAD